MQHYCNMIKFLIITDVLSAALPKAKHGVIMANIL